VSCALKSLSEKALDKTGIASRLRGLIGGQNEGNHAEIARRLGVDEVSLRMSVDELSPYPTVDVLAAVVLAYGVDPQWLITGEYSSSTHRQTAEGSRDLAAESVRLMIEQRAPAGDAPRAPGLRLLRDA
jgi:hypothetical protein